MHTEEIRSPWRTWQKRTLGVLLLAVVSPLVLGQHAQADDPVTTGIAIQPLRIEHVSDPGSEISGRVRAINRSAATLDMIVTLEDIVPDPNSTEGAVLFQDAGERSVKNWSTLFPLNVLVEGNNQQDIFYSLHIPSGATPGTYYGAFQARTNNPNASVQAGVSSLLLITVRGAPGSLHAQAAASEGAIPSVVEGGPVALSTLVTNTGNVSFKAAYHAFITDWKGVRIAALNSSNENVLPDGRRSLRTSWEVDAGLIPAFGPFTLVQQVTWGDQGQVIALPTRTLWLLPYRFLALLFLLLAFLVLGVPRLFKAYVVHTVVPESGRRGRRRGRK